MSDEHEGGDNGDYAGWQAGLLRMNERIEPLFIKLGGRRPATHLFSAVCIPIVLLSTYLVAVWLAGALGGPPPDNPSIFASVGIPFVLAIGLLGSLVFSGSAYIAWGLTRDLEALRPALSIEDQEHRTAVLSMTTAGRRSLAIASLAGVATGVATGEAVDGRFSRLMTADYWGPMDGWSCLLIVVVSVMIAQMVLIQVGGAWRFHRLARDRVVIDVLDPRPLEPFARAAVRGVLPVMIVVASVAVSTVANALPLQFLVPFAILFLFAAILLGSSLVELRSGIRRKKDDELERVTAALRGDRNALRDSRYAEELEAASFSDLLLYRLAVERAKEWVVAHSDLTRFVLYVTIPIASWLTAALIEWLVSAYLGS